MSGGAHGMDVDEPSALPTALELHDTAYFREQRIVLATSDVLARLEAGAALSHQDGPAGHVLPGERFDPEPLSVAVPTVTRASLTFFVRHGLSSLSLGAFDGLDSHGRERLPVAACPAILLATLLLENYDFSTSTLFGDGSGDRGAIHVRLAKLEGAVTIDKHHLVEADRISDLSIELLDSEPLTGRRFLLFSAGFDDCVQGCLR